MASAKDLAARPGTVGRALPVVELEIRSSGDDGVGEIFARSPAQMSGYYGTDDDPTQTTDGWIATGDLGRIVDGYLYLTGRSKDLIIRGGENIAAAHVEANLTRHPAVREVAVVALPDADLGEIVAAAVRLDDGDTTTIDDLIATARQQLAYFEVPSRWWVRTTELPTNQAGKIDKPALRRTFPDAPRTDERTPPDQSRGDQR